MGYKITVVSASWCKNCLTLKDSLTQANVIYHVVDADSEDGMNYCTEHNVRGLPTTIITDEDGKVVRNIVGLQPASVFQEYVNDNSSND
jgi:thioredoxin-like negative regulator of GroEL